MKRVKDINSIDWRALPLRITAAAPLFTHRRLDSDDCDIVVTEPALCFKVAGVLYVHPDRWPHFAALGARYQTSCVRDTVPGRAGRQSPCGACDECALHGYER